MSLTSGFVLMASPERTFSRLRENNERHEKEVTRLVSGVESGLSRAAAATSLWLYRFVVCALAHKAEIVRKESKDLRSRKVAAHLIKLTTLDSF